MNRTIKIALGSIVIGIIVLGLKTVAWQITGSVALLSDALESTVNVATAVAALIAIRIAQRPADRSHPYGHHKAEFLSAVLEGVMIIVAALLILEEAYQGIRNPQPLDAPVSGLLLNGFAGCINAVWCMVLIRQGRRLKSPALVADGQHLLSDVITSAGVILGVVLAIAADRPILDPILAGLVAVNILWSGWKVMSASLGGLMDKAVSDDLLRDIRSTISDHADGAIEAHDLRTRHAGRMTFIDFHLVVDGDTPVAQAHAICDRIEAALKKRLDDAQITIHVEPEHKAKHSGVLVL
ncbi:MULTISPECIES: cation diffusion facilitator family transporter [Paracoccus]|jgi:cation diffusion facilitator family transporter|uniref:Cation transporter n=1 Tax=Paracoccus aerius TaxID=1915382 RepID=A0ABS1S1E3_9RHOB|nr:MULTISPECIES: cation diffusion facilitator family transporter [Paracoccus]MBL3672527.1 cation transporter [Paracoccus aerius]QIR84812.1 cation transporter [Paracoccus sp. AK26]GHG09617.1 cadmium transporter [Paracoccus aerius]